MSILLIDAGNSRLKWALLRSHPERGARFMRRGALDLRADADELARVLHAQGGAIERVYVANVAGARVAAGLAAAARAAGLPRLRFVRTERQRGDVRCAYAQPWRFGVDRWMALIGARYEYPARALCLVSIGTATTIDLLDGAGLHRGGSITPSPRLMIDSLLKGTAGIRRRAATPGRLTRTLFARDTRSALDSGARYATAALIERALAEARTLLGVRPLLIIAGGGAGAVGPLLPCAFESRDDLVLRGLAVRAADDAT